MIPVSYNIRNIKVRKATAAATVLGLALVVFVFASTLMLGHGIDRTLGRAGEPDMAIVLRKGATSELLSGFDAASVNQVLADGALMSSTGGPRGAGEVLMVIVLDRLGTGEGVANVTIRGISDGSYSLRPKLQIVDGRKPAPGTDEVMVGQAIRGRVKGLELGQNVELNKNRLAKVVGVFSDGGSAAESEVWGDIENVRSIYKREGQVSSMRVWVEKAKFDAFKASVESSRQLNLQVMSANDYYEKQSEQLSTFIKGLGIVVATFFSFGAMLGGMITMHSAVANRQREIGTLRALGFGKLSIWCSFLLESMMLSLMGAVMGILAALVMGLVKFSMINSATFSEIVFTFEPTPGILFGSVIFGVIMGFVGGLPPAWRASRLSPVIALRA
jgi:putative ABC transport system permease protein